MPLISARSAPRNLVIIVVRGNRYNHVPDVDYALAVFERRYNSAINILFKELDKMELDGPNSGALPWGPTPWSVSSLKICSLALINNPCTGPYGAGATHRVGESRCSDNRADPASLDLRRGSFLKNPNVLYSS
jgi:hypothetical protein